MSLQTSGNLTLATRLGGWTPLAILLGWAMVAACLLVPQIEENRELTYDLARLQAQRQRVAEQVQANERFTAQIATDPTLLSRLVQRQFQLRPAGTETLDIPGTNEPRSPFQLSTVPPLAEAAPYTPLGGPLLAMFREGRPRLYIIGLAFFIIAAGLICDGVRTNVLSKPQALNLPMRVPAETAAKAVAPAAAPLPLIALAA